MTSPALGSRVPRVRAPGESGEQHLSSVRFLARCVASEVRARGPRQVKRKTHDTVSVTLITRRVESDTSGESETASELEQDQHKHRKIARTCPRPRSRRMYKYALEKFNVSLCEVCILINPLQRAVTCIE